VRTGIVESEADMGGRRRCVGDVASRAL
jgi:hypothetical protein